MYFKIPGGAVTFRSNKQNIHGIIREMALLKENNAHVDNHDTKSAAIACLIDICTSIKFSLLCSKDFII